MKIVPCLIAAAGCISSPMEYHVISTAELEPLGSAVSGPLEMIGTSKAQELRYYERMLAAYRVTLPDTAPRRVRVYDATSCSGPRDELEVIADLQSIRRVGAEAHFVIRGIDTETIYAPVSLDPEDRRYVIGKIAVVQEPDGADGAPGAWLACGAFSPP